MEILIKALQLILSLSILVLIHEFGHFIAARAFKTRVEKFYLFFNPWFSLFKYKKGDTEYGIGWLPLGGYVKIAGMIDESMDKEQMKQPPQPWEFRIKPAWQRLIIMVGGVTMNIVLAILIYIMMLFISGEQYLPTKNAKYGIACDSLAQSAGLKNGDLILSVDNKEVENFDKILSDIILNDAKTIQVYRDSAKVDVKLPDNFVENLIAARKAGVIAPRTPIDILGIEKGSEAEKAGFATNDQIISVNNIETKYYDQFTDFRNEIDKNKKGKVEIKIIRNNEEKLITTDVPESGLLGIQVGTVLEKHFELKTREYSLLEAIPAGTAKAYTTTIDYIKQIKLLFTKKDAHKSLGGFITIGSIFGSSWDWSHFWTITALLSVILAVMNLLPIPALDGGHVLFLLYEIITRRKPNEKFLEYAQMVGMILLFGLLIFANFQDIMRLF